MLAAPALSRADLWLSWDGKVRIFFTCFSPRMSTKRTKEHESGLVLGRIRRIRSVQKDFPKFVFIRLIREHSWVLSPYSPSPCEFQNFLCVYCKQGFISYQYLCTVENIKRINNEN